MRLKNTVWTSWTYLDNFIQWSKKSNQDSIQIDTIKVGTLFKGKKIKNTSIKLLLNYLSKNDFWELENDSLNQSRVIETYTENDEVFNRKAVITDGQTYVFDILGKQHFRIIKSYYPEYFTKLFPNMIDRIKFITNRDFFLKWWDKYCR